MVRLGLEQLEDRTVPSLLDAALLALAPQTSWHYAPAGNFAAGAFNAPGDPGSCGFNLVAVSSPAELNRVPAGDRAIVMLDKTGGVTPDFVQTIQPYVGDPRVFAFYVADEPSPLSVPAGNLKAEADWIHAHDPGAKAFFVMGAGPLFMPFYTPASTDMDYVGLDPYPVRSWGFDPFLIPPAIVSAELIGWSPEQLVPIYQGFGAEGDFATPNALELEVDMAVFGLWDHYVPFDYDFCWGPWAAVSTSDCPDLQAVFSAHDAA